MTEKTVELTEFEEDEQPPISFTTEAARAAEDAFLADKMEAPKWLSIGLRFGGCAGLQFVLNYTEKFVRNLDHATLNDNDVVVVNYKPKIPILISRRSKESIAEMKTIEGGTGIHKYIIVDSSIVTLDEAR